MERVRIPVADGKRMKGSLAAPRELGPRPAIIVIHEAFGLNTDIGLKAQRFADKGYVALAPDLYSTRGRMPFCIMRTMRSLGNEQGGVLDDLEACREWLAARPEVDPARIGVIGFCMGGGFALLFAAKSEIGAAAAFYGSVPKEAEALEGICPVVAGFGARDRVFGQAGARLERHLEQLNVPHDVKTYPEAGHSFMSEYRPTIFSRLNAIGPLKVGFNPEAAEDSWQRVDAFFAEHLGADE